MKDINREDIDAKTNSILTEKDTEELKGLLENASKKQKQKRRRNGTVILLQSIFLISAILLLCYSILFLKEEQFLLLICDFLMVLIALFFLFISFSNGEKSKHFFKNLNFILLTALICLTFYTRLENNKEISLLGDWTNQSIQEVLSWAKEQNIQVEQSYEYSDVVEEFGIIRQDLMPATPLNEVSILKVVISLGPDYEKEIILPDLTGTNLNRLQDEIKNLHLNNVLVKYEVNNEFSKDTILKQSYKGQMKRNKEVTFTLSLGLKESLTPVEMVDLTNLDKFDAILWCEQHGISYTITTQFSDLKVNQVISQDIAVGTTLTPLESKVALTLSKGQSIKVPNLKTMTSEEIVNWVVENNLKIEFSDRYDTTVPLGNVIEANYKEGEEISSGTLIKVVTSKGQLKFPKISTLAELRTWASTYGIKYTESYEMHNTIKKGEIISISQKEGDVIDLNTTIQIKISSGSPITVPNFYGQAKNAISNQCNNLGLNCTFYDAGYTSLAAGLAISQNIRANSTVTSGTYINIGLSKGVAQTFTVSINQTSIMNCAGNSTCTINLLKSSFASAYPGVTFQFVTKASSVFQFAGNIHENSPVKDGTKVTQGKTYQVYITS